MTCRSTAIYSFTCAHCGRPFTAYGNRHRKYCFLAHYITDDGIKTPGGKDERSSSTIKSIRIDKKHKSNALPQKRFTANCLTKKQKKNEGEIPQYYVEGNHEAITPAAEARHGSARYGQAWKRRGSTTAACIPSPTKSAAENAGAGTAQKSGTRPTNTAESSGSVITNSAANKLLATKDTVIANGRNMMELLIDTAEQETE